MYVVKPGDNFPTEEYRFAEFHAYYRLVKKNFEQVMGGSALSTYPDPVEHCNIAGGGKCVIKSDTMMITFPWLKASVHFISLNCSDKPITKLAFTRYLQ